MRVVVVMIVAGLLGAVLWMGRHHGCRSGSSGGAAAGAKNVPPVSAFRHVVMPTAREVLDPDVPGVFQPTAAGTVSSALYGSVRTTRSGEGLVASFHEGVDIAPVSRDSRGRPLDDVRAIADGVVAHVNRVAGNSNYGCYVVVLHADPLGELYTLYAHLAAVASGIDQGRTVGMGTVLGRMGNTSSSAIPRGRAHLHFEVGLISNAQFARWSRARRLSPDHGMFNGVNLQALDPLVFFQTWKESSEFRFEEFLERVPRAFTLMVPMAAQPDYFRRYPALWKGAPFVPGPVVLGCSENGTVLEGRRASEAERACAAGNRGVVLDVDEKVLGRNGCHLVIRRDGQWRVGPKGERWLEILTYQ